MPTSLELVSEADGVGPSTLKKIRKAGYGSAEELGEKSPAELAEDIDDVGFTTAVNILKVLEANNLRQRDPEEDNLYQLIELLEDLFYFDKEDQDFGVPKLMNQRRERLEQFIDEDLIETVHASIEEMEQNVSEEELEEARKKVINEINEDAIKPNGEVADEYKDSDISSVREVVENYQEKKKQAEEIEKRGNARAEVYNHIYQFFNRYYDKGDFITQRYRTQHEPPYSVPYDGSNTNFHWVTKNQYYARTSDYHERFTFFDSGNKYCFSTESGEIDEEEKIGKDTYFVMKTDEIEIEEDNKIFATFERRGITKEDLENLNIPSNAQDKQGKLNEKFKDIIAEKVKEKGLSVDREDIKSKITEYTKKNQEDFFIHRNLGSFLESELEEYIKSEIIGYKPAEGYKGANSLTQEKAKVVNDVSVEIISFLTQIEEFKRKLFEKKKFVTDSNHLVPVAQIDEEDYEKVLSKNEQISEWEELYDIDSENLSESKLKNAPYNRMLVDTSLFEENLISRNPENKLIKGDNYQALELLKNRYSKQIKTVYIDPPYNTSRLKDEEPNFAYKDSYERPVWLSMMKDRISVAYELLQDDGVIFVHIDDNEVEDLRRLLDEKFGEKNFLGQLVWNLNAGFNQSYFKRSHEYILVYAKDEKKLDRFNLSDVHENLKDFTSDKITERAIISDDKNTDYSTIEFPKGSIEYLGGTDVFEEGENMGAEREKLIVEDGDAVFEDGELQTDVELKAIWAMKNMIEDWLNGETVHDSKGQKVNRFFIAENGKLKYEKSRDSIHPKSVLSGFPSGGRDEIENIFGYYAYDHPKPSQLVKELLALHCSDGDTVLDFFAGSGPTAQAVLELNRELNEEINYVMVELLDKAFEITKERIQRLAYSGEWKDGEPKIDRQETLDQIDATHNSTINPIQCIELESYEDALDSVDFGEEQSSLSQHTDYLLNYMLDFETVSASLMKTGVDRENEIFSKPLEYKLNRDAQKDTTADLMTTFNYLLGLRDVEYEQKDLSGVDYSVYTGVMDDEKVLIIWRHDASEVEDYETERKEFDAGDYDHIYVNGDSAIPGAKLISSAFKRKMFGGE